MNSTPSSRYCLATVTTPSFVTGTLVLIHSFMDKNPWFNGDILVMADLQTLAPQDRELLCDFKGVKLRDISAELKNNTQKLEAAVPAFSGKSAQFYSLEAFNLSGYDKVLFCDSDMLFLDTIEPLFQQPASLLCCGDGPYYQGQHRNKHSFLPCVPSSQDEELNQTFNAGFMLIDSSQITQITYQTLIDMISQEQWVDNQTLHTDQRILNLFFAGQQTLLPPTYNYLLAHQNSIEATQPTDFDQVKVFHFNGPAKPWLLKRTLEAIHDNTLQFQASIQWYQQFEKLLTKKHLQSLARSIKPGHSGLA